MRKPILGEELYLVDVGNRARRNMGQQRTCTVSKIGRKYFTVSYKSSSDYVWEAVFTLDEWHEKTDYSAQYSLYESEQEYKDTLEASKWKQAFSKRFQYGGGRNTLKQLKEAAAILNITLN